MSGCVNCVWDRYGEEVEEWAAASKKAQEALQAKRRLRKSPGLMLEEAEKDATHAAVSLDEANWGLGLGNSLPVGNEKEDLLRDIPVGIREFMKTEKRLRERHAKERTAGG
jgi:hypothetical protein